MMMENFIHVWKNEFPHDLCDEIVDSFETKLRDSPHIYQNDSLRFHNANLGRKDLSVDIKIFKKQHLVDAVDHCIWRCFHQYQNYYGQLLFVNYSTSNQYKVQRTMPFGGYHEWHYENAPFSDMCLREVVWTIYLNDMPPNEAETEFLYQAVKIRPEKGSICLFPAAMTHVHRGLTVYTKPKYIVTGWFSKILQHDNDAQYHEQLQFNF